MENYLADLFALVLAVLVFTLYPASRIAWVTDQQIQEYVNAQTENFTDNICRNGYVTKDMYENFLKELAKTGYVYDVEIMHTHKVFYPLSPKDPAYSEENTFSSFDEVHPNKEIINFIYKDLYHEYKMNCGDSFSVDVLNKTRTKSNVLLSFLSGSLDKASLIAVHEGGMIKNENY